MSTDLSRAWRPAYEVYAAAGWLLASVFLGVSAHRTSLPREILGALAVVTAALFLLRLCQALHIWQLRFCLEPRAIQWITTEAIQHKVSKRPDYVWLGWGFSWGRPHTQRLYDLEKVDLQRLKVPLSPLWRRIAKRDFSSKGSPLLHGVEPVEHDVFVPLSDLDGHVFCPATTGAIKTSLLKLLVSQAIRREPRESVIVLEPKGDTKVRDFMRDECVAAGREADFAFFHRAFPSQSCRLDCLANFTHVTQIASRIGALIPSESGVDPWSAFGWRVLHLVAEGCIETLNERPTLTTIRRYVEGGVDGLLRRTLIQHFEREGVDWRAAAQAPSRATGRGSRPTPGTSADTAALVSLYRSDRNRPHGIGLVDGLVSMWEHDRIHAQKMLASLLPMLTMLTAGDLASLLSPNRSDIHDRRPILNGGSMADSGAVVYIGPDALSDAVVASAISSLVMADLTAHAGFRSNAGVSLPRVNIFADEANEVVNLPFIQALNKSRSAGYRIAFLSQTFSDFEARLGSEALARQVLGNANSVIVGRTKDQVTAKYVMEDFGKTIVQSVQGHQGVNLVADGKVLNFTSSYGERTSETLSDIVPQEALGRLPDLEYFATFSGGRIVKGRIPLVRVA